MESREIVFSSLPSRASNVDLTATEIVVARPTDGERLAKRFPAPQADRLRKALKKREESKADSFSLGFDAGGAAHIFILERGAKAFNLHEKLRKALGGLFKDREIQKLTINLGTLDVAEAKRVADALLSLAHLATWEPEAFGERIKKAKAWPKLECAVISPLKPADVKALGERAATVTASTNRIRTLADLPSNILRPGEYRKRVEARAKEGGFKPEFWDVGALKKKNAGAYLAVVQADPDTESGLLHLTFPAKKGGKKARRVALVGKGLCFDTGGYDVKTGGYMNGMHRDMTGSAIAYAAAEALARLRPDLEVHAYLALAENHISPTGYKANDVVMTSKGLSVEVVDTDAEGRMVLSDTLHLVSETKPDLMVDYATLTGAAVRSLDTRRSAVFSNETKLADLAVRAGDESGERTWAFPLGDDYEDDLKSKIADVLQCSSSKNADHIYAATFLSRFVGKDIPWVHMDLCAAEHKGGLGLVSSGTTGFGVRWTLNFVDAYFKK